MAISVGLAKVAGYCRVRPYPGCATQQEKDVGEILRLGRPATQGECYSYMIQRMKLAQASERARADPDYVPSIQEILDDTEEFISVERQKLAELRKSKRSS